MNDLREQNENEPMIQNTDQAPAGSVAPAGDMVPSSSVAPAGDMASAGSASEQNVLPRTPVFGKLGFFKTFFAGIVVLALSFFTVLVMQVRKYEEFKFSTTSEIATAGLQAVVFAALFVVGWKLIDRFDRKAVTDEMMAAGVAASAGADSGKNGGDSSAASAGAGSGITSAKRSHLLFSWNPRSVILTALLLFGLFLPYLLIFYPGTAGQDTTNQIKDFVTGTMPIEINWNAGEPKISCFLNDHHPVTDTIIFTFFVEYLGWMIGGPERGAFVYCALQAALTALAMAALLCRMEKFGMPYLYRKTGFLFLGLMPFVGLYSIVMLKDSLHSLIYIPYYLLYVTILFEGATNKRMAWIIVLSVLLALTKKTGIYFVIICNLALIFVPTVRRKWAEWAASWILPAVLMLVLLPHVLFPMFNIFPGGRQESLGFTMQMTARTYLDHKDELTPEEVRTIGAIMDLDKVEEYYTYCNYDEVKKLFNYDATDEQVRAYQKLWLQLFMRYPMSGVKALFATAGGFFSPTEGMRAYYEFPENKYVIVKNPEYLAPYRDAVETVFRWMCTLPGVDLFMQCVLYMWWLPLAVLMRVLLLPEFKGRRMRSLGCLVPVAISVLVLWVSPYSIGRYGLPIIYTLPLIMGVGSRR